MIRIFDTHAHYSDKIYDSDRDYLFREMHSLGVDGITLIGASLEESKLERNLAIKYKDCPYVPKLYFTIGDHPDEIPKFSPESENGANYIDELENLTKIDEKVCAVAIGEIGLDYHGDFKTNDDYDNQKKWFIAEIEIAKKLGLPIVVHSRDACEDTLSIIKECAKDLKGIIHCFSYELETALEYVKLGYYIGVGGVVTFKNGRKLKEVVKNIPLEHIVAETDAPWLSPTPHRGERNNSSYIRYVIEEIANIKQIDEKIVYDTLFNNALNVYGLKL